LWRNVLYRYTAGYVLMFFVLRAVQHRSPWAILGVAGFFALLGSLPLDRMRQHARERREKRRESRR
jgi:hypothetical protein